MASGNSKLILIFKGWHDRLSFCPSKSQRAQESVDQDLDPRSGFVHKVAGSPWASVLTILSPPCPRRIASPPPTPAHPTRCHVRLPREAGSLFSKPELGCSLKTQHVSAGRVRPCVLVPSIFGPQIRASSRITT